ncbi:MAG: glycosyltransferase family 2 protein [Candidatus Moraniibacteriota bacterium]|nr:MAG: glycosyltransferase family 2 protein [Candidatus Moranbacteria bacterium]
MNYKNRRVFVVVLNYNGKATIISCLKHIYASKYPNFEVVVVDNASFDGSLELAKKNFSRAHFIINGKNSGFSAGMNLGIRFSLEKGADDILLVNNDAFLSPNTIKELSFAQKKYGPGVYSPKILFPNGSIWFSYGKIDWFRLRAIHEDNKINKDCYPSDYVPGCVMLVSKEVYKKIGLFDERFFLYYEDVDFCFRSKNAGFGVYVVSKNSIVHEEVSESNKPKKTYFLIRSGNLFFHKNMSLLWRPWLYIFQIVRKIKSGYLFRGNSNNAMIRSVYLAIRSLPYEE